MATFQTLLDQYAFLAYEKQTKLQRVIGRQKWRLDTKKAVVRFGKRLSFPVQFLGTESEVTHTWLWADANPKVGFPESSLELCRAVRRIGRSHKISEFSRNKFAIKDEVGRP